MGLLDPTKAEIQRLDDGQLRTLVRKLGEAESAAQRRSRASVTAGGHDAAKDGGIDVRVEGAGDAGDDAFLPPGPVGLQVKATLMPEPAIRREMRPKGVLRRAIADLAAEAGTYIIACGRADHADAAYQAAVAVMRDCLGDLKEASRLKVDFYDADRLAAWTARHPGVAAWVLEQVGRSRHGWAAYGPWSARHEPADAAYLVDNTERVIVGRANDLVSAVEALDAVRLGLTRDRSAVRLIGLSGMGKTRFAEALFDARVGEGALQPVEALYGDAGAEPEVGPLELARSLAEGGEAAVLIVDNCPDSVHRRLVEIQREPRARFRLLTIDFDVEPDQPEHTTVVFMSQSGPAVIGDLLRARAPALSRADRDRVVTFADGNARIALALAHGATSGSLARLEDRELVNRLFLNDRRPDDDLRRVARVAALPYAIEDDDEGLEVSALAQLAGVSPQRFHEKLGDLLERGLAQRRGRQVAILPQALAAMLVGEALTRIRAADLMAVVYDGPNARLAGSAARQLSQLHDDPVAVVIARRLLAADGRYAAPDDDEGPSMQAVYHLGALDPEAALRVAEALVARLASGTSRTWYNLSRRPLVSLLRALAYEPALFPRAAEALMTLASQEPEQRGFEPVREVVPKFFRIAYSGTAAPPEIRFEVLERWLVAADPARAALVRQALAATLETSIHPEESLVFGARSRSQGWAPADEGEQVAWVEAAVALLERAAGADPECAPDLWRLYAQLFPVLISALGVEPVAIDGLRRLKPQGFWASAWFSACRALHGLDGDERTPALLALETELRPVSLDDRFAAWMTHAIGDWEDPFDGDADNWAGALAQATAVGVDAAQDPEAYARLTRRALAEAEVFGLTYGEGLAAAAPDPETGWRRLMDLAGELPDGTVRWPAVAGYLHAVHKSDPARAEGWLDDLMADPRFAHLVLDIQTTLGDLDARGADRLSAVLPAGASAEALRPLQRIRPAPDLPLARLAPLVAAVLDAGDFRAALHLIGHARSGDTPWPPELLVQARRILAAAPLNLDRHTDQARRVGEIAERVFAAPEGEVVAEALLERIVAGFSQPDRDARPRGLSQLTQILFRLYPRRALDSLVGRACDPDAYELRRFLRADEEARGGRPAIGALPPETVMAWIAEDPASRVPTVASIAPIAASTPSGLAWTPLAEQLLALPELNDEAFEAIEMALIGGFFTGRISDRFRGRHTLLRGLKTHPQAAVGRWATEAAERMLRRAEDYDLSERADTGRFE